MIKKNTTLTETSKNLLKTIESIKRKYPLTNTNNQYIDITLASSNYAAYILNKYPSLINLFNKDTLSQKITEESCYQQLSSLFVNNEGENPSDFSSSLRKFRHHMLVLIISRMANGFATTEQTLSESTALAISCIKFAEKFLYSVLANKYGYPSSTSCNKPSLLVIAMGKLGGNELNLSSDIDLIFAYEFDGQTETNTDEQKTITNKLFFTYLAQKIITTLSEQQEHGFAYRVDMRLRPYGSSGALVSSLSELDKYYSEQARSWERFALVRAKVLTGTDIEKDKLQSLIGTYVYRRYVDFSIINKLRKIQKDIQQQRLNSQIEENNIKRGRGGIREVEFIAQAHQLIYGGKNQNIRSSSTVNTLKLLSKHKYINEQNTNTLIDAYLSLRKSENFIQALDDQQKHTMPVIPDEQERMAMVMGYKDWSKLEEDIQVKRDSIHRIFDTLIFRGEGYLSPKYKVSSKSEKIAIKIFSNELLDELEISDINKIDELIKSFNIKLQKSSTEAQELTKKILPFLIEAILKSENIDLSIERVIKLLDNIIRRPVYLNLIYENTSIIPLLVYGLAKSTWIYDRVIQQPSTLELFIRSGNRLPNPSKTQSLGMIRNLLIGVPEDDYEQQINTIRQFSNISVIQTALAQITNNLTLKKVSDWLTYTAEVCVEQALHIAWKHLTATHGLPIIDEDNSNPELYGFAIIGYGKLGGYELNYNSDLDLVFVYSAKTDDMTSGKRSISNLQFYTKLAQRVIHILSTPTPSGNGYQLDTRLRPQGNKGLLVSSITGLKQYLVDEAWTWEHQALIRSRAITGDKKTISSFNKLREDIICKKREYHKVKEDIVSMRKRINDIKDSKDLKYAAGSLIDIEFLVQFMVLTNAHDYPALVEYSDNLRQIEALQKAKILSKEDMNILISSYLAIRSVAHSLAIGIDDHNIDIDKFIKQVKVIQQNILYK